MATPVSSKSSVGNGASPTRVVYVLATPITWSMRVGPTPVPVHAAPAIGLLLVTKGYVPKSMSRSAPWAPSKSTCLPWSRALFTSRLASQMKGSCLLYTSDAADDLLCVDLGGRRI